MSDERTTRYIEDAMSDLDRYERENAGKGWDDKEPKPGPNDVIFTQFLRENREAGFRPGQRRTVWTTVSPELKAMADAITAAGYKFECEELSNMHVHLDCCNDDHALANAVVPNGPGVVPAVEKVIRRAHARIVSGDIPTEEPTPPGS